MRIFKPLPALFIVAALLSANLLIPGESWARKAVFDIFSKGKPQQHFIKTVDGWTLSLYRYKPSRIKEGTVPVILCHGFNYNSNLWDLDKRHSFATYLKQMGYDTWTVNLRGSGDSSKPAMSDFRSLSKLQISRWPRALMRIPFNVKKFSWNIDDHIHKDLPAIIEFVKSQTRRDQITWIGHSMGGVVMYGYLETQNQDNVKNFVAIGTTVIIPERPKAGSMLAMIASQKPVTNASLLINTTVASQLRNFTLGTMKLPWEELFYNKENMDRITALRMFRIAIDDTAPGVINQYVDMIKNGELTSADKKFNYTRNLHKIKVPILFIVGVKDKMGSPESARYAFENVSSKDKKAIVFSKANGHSADYGHCDLVLGKNPEEVYSYIYGWLKKR
jgi:pimeloyl-ACP methyl ester carboxylesterase